MEDEFSDEAWFDSIASLLAPEKLPVWSTSVSTEASCITVAIADGIEASALRVEVGHGALVVRCDGQLETLVLRGVEVQDTATVARWNAKLRTLRVPFTRHHEVPNAERGWDDVAQDLDTGDDAAPCESGREKVPSASRKSSVAGSVESALAAIEQFDSRSKQLTAKIGQVHDRALTVLGRPHDEDAQIQDMSNQKTTSDMDLERVAFEGLVLFEDPLRVYGAPATSTGILVWPAATALARVLRSQPCCLPPCDAACRVLELGSGLGAVGLFAAKHWPRASVVLSDVETALPLLAKNMAANFEGQDLKRITVEALLWGPAGVHQCAAFEGPDVVLGSDICYRRDLMELVLWTVCRLRANCTLIALADRETSVEDFSSACARHDITLGPPWHFAEIDVGKRIDVLTAQTDVYVYQLFLPGSTLPSPTEIRGEM